MTFTTPVFLVFLVVVFLLYWPLPRRGQNALLLGASLVFYGWWDWRYLFLLLFTAGVDYGVALGLARSDAPGRRRALLLASLTANLGVLATFKYFDFFAGSLRSLLSAFGFEPSFVVLHLILPVGVSFYTFQALSYTIDVYRGRLAAVRDPLQYLCFISFFPQLVAGPIERAERMLPQYARERRFDPEAAHDGLRQMLWGFFKKMVVADTLAPFVTAAYTSPSTTSGWQLAWATYGFAFQIYCDFSGYTDIAIGCARLFDFRLMRNFDYPYFSRSIPEFWQRWHISLSTWFRDYLYMPLGGNRVSRGRWAFNILVVFGLSGLWHGANWTFVIWGLLHGGYYLAFVAVGARSSASEERQGWLPGLRELAAMVLTFHLTCLAWVFFRAASVPDALLVLSRILAAPFSGAPEAPSEAVPFLWAGLLLLVEWFRRREPHALHWPAYAGAWRWAAYYAIVWAILLGASLSYTPFIYFQF
jgi:D-alanyl-lipoteichoic acid acyltransferase DltB (MBOAT superfamily)